MALGEKSSEASKGTVSQLNIVSFISVPIQFVIVIHIFIDFRSGFCGLIDIHIRNIKSISPLQIKWVKGRIQKPYRRSFGIEYVNPSNRTITLVKVIRPFHSVHRVSATLQQELSRQPRPEEIAERAELKIAEVREALQIGQPASCLDEVVSHDDGRTVSDTIADPKDTARADSRLMERSRSEDLRSALDKLPPREARIVTRYFGLGSEPAMTLEEIGRGFGLTRERIRQLKERALGRLRRQEHAPALMEHYQDS